MNLAADVAAYAANPLFANFDEWVNELYLNIGLNEGEEWFGTYRTATTVEFTVLGDTINHAGRLSDFARYGAVWATKNLIGKHSQRSAKAGRPGRAAGPEPTVR